MNQLHALRKQNIALLILLKYRTDWENTNTCMLIFKLHRKLSPSIYDVNISKLILYLIVIKWHSNSLRIKNDYWIWNAPAILVPMTLLLRVFLWDSVTGNMKWFNRICNTMNLKTFSTPWRLSSNLSVIFLINIFHDYLKRK